MSKKKDGGIKNLIPYISIATVILTLLGGWFKFQAMAENTKTKVDELSKDVKEATKESNDKIEKLKYENGKLEKSIEVNKVQQDNIQREVQQIADKTDKILTLIMESQKKK